MERRVVITGLGTINPLGNNVKDFWNNIKNGESGIGRLTHVNADLFPSKIAGQIKDFDAVTFFGKKEAKRMDDFTVYAMVAAQEAMEDSAIKEGELDPTKFGVIIGNGIGGIKTLEDNKEKQLTKGPLSVEPLMVPKLISNICPAMIAIRFNAQGPCYAVVTACSSGTDAIGSAVNWIRNGTTDVMIAGGTEAPITMVGVGGFCVLKTLSTAYNDNPTKASRPFDKNRDGFIISEGAGILVLEELEHAKKRGAEIYAEFAGYGCTCDANHLTAPHPEGRGAIAAIRMAIRNAGLLPEDIDYINAHGTSTPINDPAETKAINAVFNSYAKKLKVSSTKSMTGHLLGGAGGVEGIITTLAIRDQFFPPTINYEEADPECDLDYVPNKGYPGRIRAALSNSLGFGGHNGILCIKEYQD